MKVNLQGLVCLILSVLMVSSLLFCPKVNQNMAEGREKNTFVIRVICYKIYVQFGVL